MSITKEAINHSVVLKHDPYLSNIFFTSSVCTVYQFNLTTGQWDKLGVQGTLFLYSRTSQDQIPYAALVLNRNNNADFNLGLIPHYLAQQNRIEVKFENDFVMIQVSPNEIYGLWLFDPQDRVQCLSLVQWCLNNGST